MGWKEKGGKNDIGPALPGERSQKIPCLSGEEATTPIIRDAPAECQRIFPLPDGPSSPQFIGRTSPLPNVLVSTVGRPRYCTSPEPKISAER